MEYLVFRCPLNWSHELVSSVGTRIRHQLFENREDDVLLPWTAKKAGTFGKHALAEAADIVVGDSKWLIRRTSHLADPLLFTLLILKDECENELYFLQSHLDRYQKDTRSSRSHRLAVHAEVFG